MNNHPTDINIVVNKHHGKVDIMIDLSTGPETKRIATVRVPSVEIERIMGDEWSKFFNGGDDNWKLVDQINNFCEDQYWDGRDHYILLSDFLFDYGHPPTFNEWEKAKLMQDLQ